MKYLISFSFLIFISINVLDAQIRDTLFAKGNPIILSPIFHGAMVLQWNGGTIYVDPYGGAERYQNLPRPDLVLITHVHGDHLNPQTLNGLDLSNAELVAPRSVIEKLGPNKFQKVSPLRNGEQRKFKGIPIGAVPMYNLPETDDSRHPKGKGNGYVITLGGQDIYISGDTEDIPEMRQLKGIEYAFVCMNLPYTMDVNQAASAVIDFQPRVVFPYHFRGRDGKFSDINRFKALVNQGAPNVDVRLRDWYWQN